MPMIAALVLSVVACAEPGCRQEERTSSGVRVEIVVEPFIDLWFSVRAMGSSREPIDVPELLKPAADAARALDQELGGALAWGIVEGTLRACHSAADARKAFASVPETYKTRAEKVVKLRERALNVVDELAKVETAWREKYWADDEKAIRAAQSRLATGFLAKQAACFELCAQSIGVAPPDLVISSYLVARAPAPGAITHRDDDHRGICFVSVNAAEGTQLDETVLHEATHALDLAIADDVFDALRERLAKADVKPDDRVMRDAPHTLMFVNAAETIRRVVDPKHVDYGDASGYYAKVQAIADVERPLWKQYLDRKITRDEALDGIVKALRK
jgi:hypothetical protein